MAKHVKLNQAFADPDDATATPHADQEAEPMTTTVAKKAPAKKAAKKAASKRTAKKAPAPARKAEAKPVWATDEVTVRATDTKSAKPFNVALHPDDLQALDIARAMSGGDRQSRIRTMVALWRGNPEFREAVEEHRQHAPRGGY